MGDLAVTKHDVRPPFIAPPPGLRFATPRSLSTPIQADYSHFKSSSRTMFFKADEMPFSTDYTEWGLRSSERDCEGPLELAMIMDESDEARPRHRDGHGHQDPGHRHFLLRDQPFLFDTDFGRSLDRKSTCEGESPFRRTCRRSRPVDWRHRQPKARRGAKTRPKARRREQGTEVELELRPLRHNTTKGAF